MGRKLLEIFAYLAFKIQTPGKFPEEYKLHSEHGESLKTTVRHSCGEETTRNIRLFGF